MSLDSALNTALTGLQASQSGLNIVSNNIANADVEGYNRRVIVQETQVTAGETSGTRIAAAQRQVNDYIVAQSREQNSTYSYAKTRNDYLDQLATFYGQPGQGTSLSERVDEYFIAFNNVANNPEDSALRTLAVQRGNELASNLSGLANNLERTRFTVDQEIDRQVDALNFALTKLEGINLGLNSAQNGSVVQSELLDQRDILLNEISAYLDITVSFDDGGAATIYTQETTLIGSSVRSEIAYIPTSAVESIIGDSAFQSITATLVDTSGKPTGQVTNLVAGGTSDEVRSSIDEGSLAALVDLRDNDIPDLLDQLDLLAASIIDNTNELHNKGTGYPPPNSITGVTEIRNGEEFAFSGQVMVALLTQDGLPVPSPYSNEATGLKPLTIDFSQLSEDELSATGFVSLDTIKQEIEQYYTPNPRVNIGQFQNIELATTTDASNSSVLSVNLAIDSIQSPEISLSTSNLRISGPVAFTPAGPSATIPTPAYDVDGINVPDGDQFRSIAAGNLEFDFVGQPAGSYDIAIPVTVLDANGQTLTSTLTYTVNYDGAGSFNSPDGSNQRIGASSATGDATLVNATNSAPLVEVDIVDADGNIIPPSDTTTEGFLRIQGADGTGYRIAIDELDSRHLGRVGPSDPLSSATATLVPGTGSDRGFSYHFGMNNYFEVAESQENAAINMAVEERIIDDPGLFAAGNLSGDSSVNANDPTLANYTFSIGVGNNQNAENLASLRNKNISFATAGGLNGLNTTLDNYTAQLTSRVSLVVNSSSDNLAREQVFKDVFESQIDGASGVNVDEELAAIIELENAYAASAQIINTVQELFDVLFRAIG